MAEPGIDLTTQFHANFKLFYELMADKIRELLLVSSAYDSFIVEEDTSLASRIINEYRGLNLSQPPRVTRASSAGETLDLLVRKRYDLVITMPHLEEMDVFTLGKEIKKIKPTLPVYLLAHSVKGIHPPPENAAREGIDKVFIWLGNSDLLLALIKSAEDAMNADRDTRQAQVRVLILVEDSPVYYSMLLPFLYKEIVRQTQAVLEAGLNEEHRLLIMRTRPKILLARSYDEALDLYERYKPYLMGVISDSRIPRQGELVETAGLEFIADVRKEIPHLPLLTLSAEEKNRSRAVSIPGVFLNKNSPHLLSEIHDFFMNHLGFGDFVFRSPDGTEIDRASTLRELEKKLATVSEESILYHAQRNQFSSWILSRSEITLASAFRNVSPDAFPSIRDLREYLITTIHQLRKWRQKGVVAAFNRSEYDSEIMDFVKVGQGSLGGKARGLAFMSTMLRKENRLREKYPQISLEIPRLLVLCTDLFEEFISRNNLGSYARYDYPDEEIAGAFLKAELPPELVRDLEAYLCRVRHPLSVRSSSLLEDAQFQPYAGLYSTYMLPNNHPHPDKRLQHLIAAVKLVYASTYFEGPKAFARNTLGKPQDEAMAVIIQQLAGRRYGEYHYPVISGVAQSHNFYPMGRMKAEDGVVHAALGYGKTVVDGESSLRFSPRHPAVLPQYSTVEDMLKNAQRFFYALLLKGYPEELSFAGHANLERREIHDARDEFPVRYCTGTFDPRDGRIIEGGETDGPRIVTFSRILKHRSIPVPDLITDLLELGRKSLGCPVEMEFAVDIESDDPETCTFSFLQIRPMAADDARFETEISSEEIERAVCFSARALGNGVYREVCDIVYVKPDDFRLEDTVRMAEEVGRLNTELSGTRIPYMLVGPGRWGSLDRWLGIPVRWEQISGVRAIVELRNDQIKADPSQGAHFFHNLTSAGIPYVTVTEGTDEFFRWDWISSLAIVRETTHLRHVRLEKPLVIKINGEKSQCVMYESF